MRKHFLLLGKNRAKQDRIGEELKNFQQSLVKHERLREVFCNPSFPIDKRLELFKVFFQKKNYATVTQHFLSLLVEKKRTHIFDTLASLYQGLLDKENNVLDVRVASASELGDSYLEKLQTVLEKKTGKTVRIQTEVNTDLIGGIVTWIGDTMYDDSLKTRLRLMKDHLAQ